MNQPSLFSRLFLATLLSVLIASFATHAWAAKHPYYSKHPKAAKQLEQLLAAARIQALEMQPAGLSVTLKNMNNKDQSLEDFQGKVMLLTRWATWCGACRSEMPLKVQLHQQLKDPRFQLIGVSSEGLDKVAGYIKNNPNAYPVNLLDPSNKMSSFFPGGAIPVTVLVDAWGWTIGMKQGGARWNSPVFVQLMKLLMKHAPSKQAIKINLPKPIVAYPKEVKVQVGQPFSLIFHVDWNGESDKFSRISLQLGKSKHLQQLGISTKGVDDNQSGNKRQYILRMKLNKKTELSDLPIKMKYQLKDYNKAYTAQVGQITIRTMAATTQRKAVEKWPYILLASAVFLALLVFFLIQRQGSGNNEPSEEDIARQQREQTLQAMVSNLKEAHDGTSAKEQIEPIFEIYNKVLDEVPDSIRTLRDDIRYGGHDFPTEKRRQVMAQLASALKSDFPDIAKRIQAM